MSNPFETYAANLEDLAETWPTVHPLTAAPELEHVRYNVLADAVSETIATRHPETPELLVSYGARYGQKVLLRYCLMAAHLAKESDFSLNQLAELMTEPRSFETLGILASHPLPVVSPTEEDFNLKYHIYPVEPYSLDNMNIRGGFVDLVGLERTIIINEHSAKAQGVKITDGKCAAHHNKVLEPIYYSLVHICLRDENLFQRTLEK